MIVKTYKAKVGARISDEDAERIGQYLEKKVINGDRGVSAEEFVGAARPESSPLHGDLEWDDSVAGHQYRLQQAREILRSIMVVHVNGETSQPTRAFHRVVVADDATSRSAYVPASVVWEKQDYAAQVLEKARRELRNWSRRYREYEELAGAAALVSEALELIAA